MLLARPLTLSFTPLIALSWLVLTTQAATADLRFLVEGRSAVFQDLAGEGEDFAFIYIGGDRGLDTPIDPTCPQSSSFELAAIPDLGDGGFLRAPAATLPCSGWSPYLDGYVYVDPTGSAGGVQYIIYRPSHLAVWAGGPGFAPLVAPMALAQMRLVVGDTDLLARFYQPAVNDSERVVFLPPTLAAARGEQAFWDSISHASDRTLESLYWLSLANQQDPNDGRAHFLKGMLHIYRANLAVPDWQQPNLIGWREMVLARQAFDLAGPLLWDGERGDSRVPGFAAAPPYFLALMEGDRDQMETSVAQMEAAVELNPIFNNFIVFAVAPTVPPDDPLFDKALVLAEDLMLGGPGGACVRDQPEICADTGLAAHNTAGALALVGDILAKGSRRSLAALAYQISRSAGLGNNWPYQPLIEERIATLDERIALHNNGNPDDDPLLMGSGDQACVVCHGQ